MRQQTLACCLTTSSSKRGLDSASDGTPGSAKRARQQPDELREALRDAFHLPDFRPRQREVVRQALRGRDCFVVLPTGGGKSLCFQLPAVLSAGLTVVVSPLVSLMRDQVQHLLDAPCGGIPAGCLGSSIRGEAAKLIMRDMNNSPPQLKLLYVTPEKLQSESLKDILGRLHARRQLARFVIDEAHCMVQWGHDFRKDYIELKRLRKTYKAVPIMALTATATRELQREATKMLGLRQPYEVRTSFNRANLHFAVRPKPHKRDEQLAGLLTALREPALKGSGIVYCMTRKDTEEVANFLLDEGMSADFYHAGQTDKDRMVVQSAWQRGQCRIVCATIAYGMGIDKADCRFVLHFSLPKSVEGYMQEVGRAGRDGKRAECVLFYRAQDAGRLRGIITMKKRMTKRLEKEVARLKDVQSYCEDGAACRRKLLLAHFSEPFDPARCCQTCDNCRNK